MRVLLDECVPADLAKLLLNHDVTTVSRMRMASATDRNLLQRAASEFDVFLTVDHSLVSQQRIPDNLALITLRVPNNRMPVIQPLVPDILAVLDSIKPGERIEVGETTWR